VVGRLPFLAVGTGAPMLYIGGLAFQAGVDAPGSERTNASLLAPFATRRRVLFVNRRRGLPRGMSMAELASEHADAIRSLDAGPVDVAGLSTGGSIAQQLAADHPDVVDRLVLLCSACPARAGGASLAAPGGGAHSAWRAPAGARRDVGGARSSQARPGSRRSARMARGPARPGRRR
jgi:pimeloyl-ACP methyl ester carboxylesterase